MIEQLFGAEIRAFSFLLLNLAGMGTIACIAGKWILKRLDTALDGYAGETGKLTARLHALEGIVKETRANEQAKLEARFDNLDRSVEETRRLAIASETIKHSLSHQAWLRDKRLQAYTDMLASLQGYANICQNLATAERQVINAVDRNWPIEISNKAKLEHNALLPTFHDAQNNLVRSIMNLHLVGEGEPLMMVRSFKPGSPNNADELDAEAGRVAVFMANLMKAAGDSLAHPGMEQTTITKQP